MKNYVFGLCALLLFSCKEHTTAIRTTEAELKEFVTGETLAYMEKEYDKWASYWDHSSEVLRLDVTPTGFAQTRGWDKSGGNLRNFFKENPEPISATFENSNYLILVDSELAWLAFDQTWRTEEGEESVAKATVTLVKRANAWKIISYTAIQYDAEATDADTLTRD